MSVVTIPTLPEDTEFKLIFKIIIPLGYHTMARSRPENLVGGVCIDSIITSQNWTGQYSCHLSTTSSAPNALQNATDFTAFDPHTTLEMNAYCFLFFYTGFPGGSVVKHHTRCWIKPENESSF